MKRDDVLFNWVGLNSNKLIWRAGSKEVGGNEMRNVVAENISVRGHTFPNRSEEPQGGWRWCRSCVWGRGPVRTFGCIVKQAYSST